MDPNGDKGVILGESDPLESTSDSNLKVSMMPEDVPPLTVTTIVGMIVIMLIAIAAVFLLGVLIDCRQQRLIEKKMGEVRRRSHRPINVSPEDDSASIANNMEPPAMSVAPAEVLTHAP